MGFLRIGEVYRYARPYSPKSETIDGLPNFFHRLHIPGHRLPLAEAGINPIAPIRASEGLRYPAIIISSSPHKIGSRETPWEDTFDVDNGFIRYFGDNKSYERDPARAKGNALLLRQLDVQTSPDMVFREHAVPIVFFRRVHYGGRAKGNLEFQGLAILTRAERVTQYNQKQQEYFSNYVFDFAVLSLTHENEMFDWRWIAARGDSSSPLSETTKLAPTSWREWLRQGPESVERCRRRVSKLLLTPTTAQRPLPGTREEKTVRAIYEFYAHRKSRFEALASRVTQNILQRNGIIFKQGWITPPGSDGGTDFVGRIDIGSGFASTKLVVLGQAKCEKLDTPTGGNHVARTVARLRRGWVGVYVTTSYFSEAVQREVVGDQYLIILVNGLELSRVVLHLIQEGGFPNIEAFLTDVDHRYDSLVRTRRPEEILLD
jgi:hypothetical protein